VWHLNQLELNRKAFQLLLEVEVALEKYLDKRRATSGGPDEAPSQTSLDTAARKLEDVLSTTEFDQDRIEARILAGRVAMLKNEFTAALEYFKVASEYCLCMWRCYYMGMCRSVLRSLSDTYCMIVIY